MQTYLTLMLFITACGDIAPTSHQDGGARDSGTSCVAETDPAFCTRVGATCEAATADDNCGVQRTAACGTCGGADACVANTCKAPVCSGFSFPNRTLVTALNDSMQQDAVVGVSSTGTTVLAQRSACGGAFQTLLADSNGVTLVPADISANSALAGMLLSEEGTLALGADGLTIIGTSSDGTKFLSSSRTAVGTTTFATATGGDFAALAVTAPDRIDSPAISADGLAFYYRITGDANTTVNGIYETVRHTKTEPFPAGTQMPALVNQYQAVTAISSDRMTLFLATNAFTEVVLTRKSVTTPFANPNTPAPPPTVPGFRTRPLGDCQSVIATYTVSGCTGEENAVYTK
jgi:hypothetical protein